MCVCVCARARAGGIGWESASVQVWQQVVSREVERRAFGRQPKGLAQRLVLGALWAPARMGCRRHAAPGEAQQPAAGRDTAPGGTRPAPHLLALPRLPPPPVQPGQQHLRQPRSQAGAHLQRTKMERNSSASIGVNSSFSSAAWNWLSIGTAPYWACQLQNKPCSSIRRIGLSWKRTAQLSCGTHLPSLPPPPPHIRLFLPPSQAHRV